MKTNSQSAIDQVLSDHDLFTTMRPELRAALVNCAERGSCPKDTILFKTGEPAMNFYLIEQGSVRLEAYAPSSGNLTIATLKAAEILGWSWLFPPYDWHFNAVAAEDLKFISFDASKVRRLCDSNHEFGYELMKRFGQIMLFRLMATRYQVMDLYKSTPG